MAQPRAGRSQWLARLRAALRTNIRLPSSTLIEAMMQGVASQAVTAPCPAELKQPT